MTSNLRKQIRRIISDVRLDEIGISAATDKIMDLLDEDAIRSGSTDSLSLCLDVCDSLVDSYEILDQALDEQFAVIDKIKAALNPASVVEEIRINAELESLSDFLKARYE